MMTLETTVLSIEIAVFAWTISNILMSPGMILWRYAEWLERIPVWLSKPLGLCEKCMAGQIAFWYYVATSCDPLFSIVPALVFAVLTVFMVHVIDGIVERYLSWN